MCLFLHVLQPFLDFVWLLRDWTIGLPLADEAEAILERGGGGGGARGGGGGGDVGDRRLERCCLSRGYDRTSESFATRYRGDLPGDRELCCFCARGDIVSTGGGRFTVFEPRGWGWGLGVGGWGGGIRAGLVEGGVGRRRTGERRRGEGERSWKGRKEKSWEVNAREIRRAQYALQPDSRRARMVGQARPDQAQVRTGQAGGGRNDRWIKM